MQYTVLPTLECFNFFCFLLFLAIDIIKKLSFIVDPSKKDVVHGLACLAAQLAFQVLVVNKH